MPQLQYTFSTLKIAKFTVDTKDTNISYCLEDSNETLEPTWQKIWSSTYKYPKAASV